VTPAVRVDRISKRYQLGLGPSIDRSFREMLVNLAKAPMRRLRHLSGRASEGWFWALREVSFAVQPGEVVAVIGANGAGKSTLLKVLSRRAASSCGGASPVCSKSAPGFTPNSPGARTFF
jgi:lipopolysaccharide transport system ATP-binding protein